jgi:tyrosine-protein kinase Etk/Wzc
MTEEYEVGFQDYLRILNERKWIVILAFAGVIAATAYFTFTSPEVYEASATLMVDRSRNSGSMFSGGYNPYGINLLQNYCQILESRSLAEKTAARLAGLSPESSDPPAPRLVQSVMGRLSTEPVRGTDIIEVSATASTGEEAARLANAAVDAFVEEQIDLARGEYTEQRQFLEEQIPLVRDSLMQAEEDLRAFKEANKFVALSEETRGITHKLSEFDRLYSEVETDINTSASRLEYLRNHLAEQQRSLPEDIAQVSSPYILELRKQLVNLETTYSMYVLQGLSEDNAKMVDLKRSIDDTKAKLVEETRKLGEREIPSLDPLSQARKIFDKILSLEAEIAALSARREALASVRGQYAERLETLPSTELTLARLERKRELSANTYRMLMQKHEEVKITEAGKMTNISVVDRATVPSRPIKPRKERNMAFGVIVGLALGMGAAFMLDYADSSVRTPTDVDRYAGLSILGSVPRIKARGRKRDEVSRVVSRLLTRQDARSTVAEAYKTIRTNIQFTSPDKPVRTVLVTSAVPGEGKSTVSANLAIALAQLGKKTLLVDADLRKPMLGRIFKAGAPEGLSDCLAGKVEARGVIQPTGVERLDLLPAGTIPPNPSELLSSNRMEELLGRLKTEYDYVIFDSPPAIAVTDAAILGSRLDGTILTVKAAKTDRFALARASEIMDRVRANVLGAILNMVTPRSGRYAYYYHYYPYYYSDYHSERSGDSSREPEEVAAA